MKTRYIILSLMAAVLASSCTDMTIDKERTGELKISVSTDIPEQTRSVVTGSKLPTGSQIGVFLTDGGGSTYDGAAYGNVLYTDNGVAGVDIWSTSASVMLSSTEGTLHSYYPYSSSVTDITSVPVDASAQQDVMWGSPVTGINSSEPAAEITMKHALAAVRVSLKKGTYVGTGAVSSVTVSGQGIATGATLNAKDGTLSNLSGAGSDVSAEVSMTLSSSAQAADVIVVPMQSSQNIWITAVIDGTAMKLRTPSVTLRQGQITTYEVTVNSQELILGSVNIATWTTSSQGSVNFDKKIKISGNTTDISWSTEVLGNGDIQLTAVSRKVGYKVNTVTKSGDATVTQTQNPDGSLTVLISDFYSNLTLTFTSTTYLEWARIQHVDGTLYTADEWLAAETAGTVTDADANGVAVRYSRYAVCPHVIHPKYATSTMPWSSNISVMVPGVYATTSSSNIDPSSCNFDVNGKANTDALLAAVTAGTIANAPAAQYCDGVTFAGGQKGYLPAAGEVCAWGNNWTAINACMDAIGGDRVGESTYSYTWTSTQATSTFAWLWRNSGTFVDYAYYKNNKFCVRAVSAFSY